MSDAIAMKDLLTFGGIVLAAAIPAFLAWAGTRGKTISDRESAKDQIELSITESWQKMAETQNKKIEAQDSKINSLTERVETLEATNRELLHKTDAYRRHIYAWREEYPDKGRWPVVPPIIHQDLG